MSGTLEVVENLEDLLNQLGGIPASRVRFRPPPGTATEADVIAALAAPRKRICELIDGVLIEKPMGFSESILAAYLIGDIGQFVRTRQLGLVTAPDGTIRLWPGRVRIPDIAYISWARLPGRRRPTEAIPQLAPDLAIEILSASNTAEEMRQKRMDYFSTGVRLVWEVDPQQRTVTIYDSLDSPETFAEDQTINGGEVLPGYTLALRDLFAELDRSG